MPRRRPVTAARPGGIRSTAGVIALAAVMWGIGCGPGYAATLPGPPAGSGSWTVYHGGPAGTVKAYVNS